MDPFTLTFAAKGLGYLVAAEAAAWTGGLAYAIAKGGPKPPQWQQPTCTGCGGLIEFIDDIGNQSTSGQYHCKPCWSAFIGED